MDHTNTRKSSSKADKGFKINGAVTTIEISASTYDALSAKKPLCEHVTKSCVNVADQVWDTFLREVAPQVKAAELIAEDNARQSCIGNISDCFQKACKDNMDPNDPDGSYDLCLTRPESMMNLCKVPLNACGIDEKSAEQSDVWDFVVARLAAMRVDACTTEVKKCLTDDDRCGADFNNCIGLDTDTIMRMCPYDKLVACQNKYGENNIQGQDVYDEIANMVTGVFLNIDNAFLSQCQNAAEQAMIKVCGDTQNCNGLTVDDNIGARSLEYKICEYKVTDGVWEIDYENCRNSVSQIMDTELGRVENSTSTQLGAVKPFAGVLDGTIYWEAVEIGDDGRVMTVDEYLAKIDGATDMSEKQKEKVKSELAVLQRNIDAAINTIESDPTVQFCMTGREVQGMKTGDGENKTRTRIGEKSTEAARFPELTKQMRMTIANAALKTAKDNYYKKYDELNSQILQDYAQIGERMAKIKGENTLDARREIARQACVNFADMSSLPKSPNPPKSAAGKIISMVAIAGAVAAIPFTLGTSTSIIGASVVSTQVASAGTYAVAAGGAAVAGLGLLGNAGSGSANGEDVSAQLDLVGSKQLNQWNYKETVTSTFDWETLKCHKCVTKQNCEKTKRPMFGNPWCKDWEQPIEECSDVQF